MASPYISGSGVTLGDQLFPVSDRARSLTVVCLLG